jgi:L-arabinokinase
VPYELVAGPCDTGIVQASSLHHDDEATVRQTLAFYGDFEARVDAEIARLAGRHVRAIVGDIPPLAFATAARLGVPSVALGNFTWDWIYEAHPGFLPDGAGVLETIRDAYRQATHALELPFTCGFDVFRSVERIPLIARRPTRPASEIRARFDLPPGGRVALLSFGGYGLPSLDLSSLDIPPGWTVVTTDRVSPGGDWPPCVRSIVEGAFFSGPCRYEDLVAAVDVVITKPGYGIIAECISTGTAMLYTSRGPFREYDVLVANLPRFVRSRFIDQSDLLAGRWRAALEALVEQPPPPERMAVNGADVVARRLAELLEREP